MDFMQNLLSEEELKDMLRARILAQASPSVVNNVYGGGGFSAPPSSSSGIGGGGLSPEDRDYFVRIGRRDAMDSEGKKVGWDKAVHRFSSDREDAARSLAKMLGYDPVKKK